jgi:hypothetical protein
MNTPKPDLVDYALPMMRVEKCLQEMHNDLLENDFASAADKALVLVAESRILLNVILLMKEQRNAVRNQTPPV